MVSRRGSGAGASEAVSCFTRSVGFLPRERSPNAPAPYQAKMRSTTAGLLLLIGSAKSLSLGLAPVRRSAVHRIVMQVSERQPH